MLIAEVDEELIKHRIAIRIMIENGKIEEAINKINDISTEVSKLCYRILTKLFIFDNYQILTPILLDTG